MALKVHLLVALLFVLQGLSLCLGDNDSTSSTTGTLNLSRSSSNSSMYKYKYHCPPSDMHQISSQILPTAGLKQCYNCINPTDDCARGKNGTYGTKVDCTTACSKTTLLGISKRICVPGANYAPDATKDSCRKKEGLGEVCFCRTNLCNGSKQSVKYSPILMLLVLSVIAALNLN